MIICIIAIMLRRLCGACRSDLAPPPWHPRGGPGASVRWFSMVTAYQAISRHIMPNGTRTNHVEVYHTMRHMIAEYKRIAQKRVQLHRLNIPNSHRHYSCGLRQGWEPRLAPPPPLQSPLYEMIMTTIILRPVWHILRAPWGRFICTASEHISYRGRDSGGGWGNYGREKRLDEVVNAKRQRVTALRGVSGKGRVHVYTYIYIYI